MISSYYCNAILWYICSYSRQPQLADATLEDSFRFYDNSTSMVCPGPVLIPLHTLNLQTQMYGTCVDPNEDKLYIQN